MTWIDPFAPGGSLQHPSHWHDGPPANVEDAAADMYQWQRDHFAMASEADEDIPHEVLQERHVRYEEYLREYGSPDEQRDDAEFVSFSTLLRRAVLAGHDDDQHGEWSALFEQHATAEERDPLWVEGTLPDLVELHARASAANASAGGTQGDGTPAPEAPLTPPRSNALKEEWVDYALLVDKARGGTLTPEQASAMSIGDLKAAYKPQVS